MCLGVRAAYTARVGISETCLWQQAECISGNAAAVNRRLQLALFVLLLFFSRFLFNPNLICWEYKADILGLKQHFRCFVPLCILVCECVFWRNVLMQFFDNVTVFHIMTEMISKTVWTLQSKRLWIILESPVEHCHRTVMRQRMKRPVQTKITLPHAGGTKDDAKLLMWGKVVCISWIWKFANLVDFTQWTEVVWYSKSVASNWLISVVVAEIFYAWSIIADFGELWYLFLSFMEGCQKFVNTMLIDWSTCVHIWLLDYFFLHFGELLENYMNAVIMGLSATWMVNFSCSICYVMGRI